LVRVDDLTKNNNKYKYSRVRLTDFKTNYQLHTRKIGEEFNFADLRSGGGGDEEAKEGEDEDYDPFAA
jgi:hypothetical protein